MANDTTTSTSTLYDRLGGIYNIAAVVDDFIDRVMDSPTLNANAAVNEGHHRVSRSGFKYLVTELVGFATGGPQKYSGRAMLDSHKHLGITAAEWAHFLGLFQQTLDKFKVPAGEQGELFAIVESTRGDIVVPGSAAPAKPAVKPKRTAAPRKPAAKKAAAKKAAVKKTAAKKPAARKPAARKPAAKKAS